MCSRKLEDCGVIHQLTGATPTVSLHLPWDKTDDFVALREHAAALGARLRRHELQHLPGPGRVSRCRTSTAASRTPTRAVRAQAVAHNIDCIARRQESSVPKALHRLDRRRREFSRPVASRARRSSVTSNRPDPSTQALPDDWRMFIEHKMYEPAFYATVHPGLGQHR